jgi:succinate dehydrogenase/fumarate reductase flavoprotein subunit
MTESIIEADIVVVGGGSAGSTAAIRAAQSLPRGRVVLLEKAHIKRSGAIAIGMDGLNNAIIPGHATPEQYVKEITMANDGIVNQRAILEYAQNSFAMIEELDRWGVKFQKTESGDFDVKKVHHKGSYVLPMPEGYDLKKILTRVLKRSGVRIVNRVMATRLLLDGDRIAGVLGFDTRDGEFTVIRAKAVILCCGASGRLGLPASGYLYLLPGRLPGGESGDRKSTHGLRRVLVLPGLRDRLPQRRHHRENPVFIALRESRELIDV